MGGLCTPIQCVNSGFHSVALSYYYNLFIFLSAPTDLGTSEPTTGAEGAVGGNTMIIIIAAVASLLFIIVIIVVIVFIRYPCPHTSY